MGPVEFLTELWGPRPPGVIQLWELERRRSHYLRSPAGAGGLRGARDLYTAVALTDRNLGPRQRARADQAVAVAGLWLDVDVDGGPDSKTGAVCDQGEAAKLTMAVAPPTLLIFSGYGVHAWWLLREPWRFTSRDEQQHAATLSAQLHALHHAAAAKRGWALDHTHDLARLLRLPGTINGKGGGDAPVCVLADDGPRYDRGDLADMCAAAGEVPIALAGADAATGGALPDVIARDPRVDHERLEALRFNVPEFERSWLHARDEHWSLSEYDLSLATHAAQAGWTDQQIADLVAHHRRLWDPADTKAQRRDYLRRTVAKARDTGQRATAAQRLAQLVGQA